MNTMQQEFDAVVVHLYKQGRQSVVQADTAPGPDSTMCAYRGKDGLMCAVGCRIPDEMYDVAMEGYTANSMIQSARRGRFVVPEELRSYSDLFHSLQRCHDANPTNTDGTFDLEALTKGLADIAQRNCLTFTAPTQGEQNAS